MPLSAYLLPIFVTIIDLIIMVICLKRIFAQVYFHYFNRDIWALVVVFGSVVGQILYLIMETND